jgi:glycogen debranching enzyme
LLGVVPAKNVLKALARYQAGQRDDFRGAEPGKIPHELRRGELAFFEQVPQIPYHGTADATPLFLILPREVWRWDSEVGFVRGRWRVRHAGRWAGSSTTPTA